MRISRGISDHMSDFTLNCSRIGVTGGLRSFSEQVMTCLGSVSDPIEAVMPESVPAPEIVRKIATPPYLGSSSGVSLLRPVAWLAYGRFRFPVPVDRKILCTTHHVLPQHRHQIVTVHDLRPYFLPDNEAQRFYFHHMLPQALRRCEGVLTVSEASRQMLIEVYGMHQASIHVVPNAIRLCPITHSQDESLTVEPRDAARYLLMVGASWSHKNADEVLRMNRYWASRFRLKIVAGAGAYRSKLEALARELGIGDRVDFLSGVSNDQVAVLYARCAAFVYPSKMEGFGLPPLEAMAHGKRVIVSDIPVFRELYGPHPYYVSLGCEESWEHAFSRISDQDPGRDLRFVAHAQSFNIDRMRKALRSALKAFWG
jgi:glycosyltransferase involved in cell wall biosynthesis